MRLILTTLFIVWFVVGAVAANQRHYFAAKTKTCSDAGTIAVTILAGPLNYAGANPKITCPHAKPST
jgi:hypothetical protein